jgi:hypothetical protein
MVVATWRRQACGDGEDVVELLEQSPLDVLMPMRELPQMHPVRPPHANLRGDHHASSSCERG